MTPSSSSGRGDPEFVNSLAQGLSVLELFSRDRPRMTLSDVSRLTGLTPATARRSLRTLRALGYLREIDRQFLLNVKVLSLGSAYLLASGADELLMPFLRKLVSEFGDASSVSVLSGDNVLYIASYSEERSVRPVARSGTTYPAFVTSMGRVLLSAYDKSDLERYLFDATFEKMTPMTEINTVKLRRLITKAGQQGYASATDQLAYGVTALAVPVIVRGQTVAALNTSAYTGNTTEQKLVAERLSTLQLTARKMAELIVTHPVLEQSLIPERAPDRAISPDR